MADLPKWVWDLIIQLETQEDTHPELYRRMSSAEYVRWNWCPAAALNSIPAEIRGQARAIRQYQQLAEQDKQEGDGDEPGR